VKLENGCNLGYCELTSQMASHLEVRVAHKLKEWPLAEAKAKFSELVEAAEKNGPQMVTKRGKAAVVIVPVDQWQKPEPGKYRNIKEWLLAPEARFDDLVIPDRHALRLRKPPKL
jgi:prevent-host-death family protein